MTTAILGLGVLEYGLFLFASSQLPDNAVHKISPLAQTGVLLLLGWLTAMMARVRSPKLYGLVGGFFTVLISTGFLLTSLDVTNAVSWVFPAIMIVPIAAGPLWLTRFQYILGSLVCWTVNFSLLTLMPMSTQEVIMTKLYFVMNLFLATVLHVIFYSYRLQNFKLLGDLKIQASQDGLTGLLNRRSFLEHCDQFLRDGGFGDRMVTALYIDLDHFKTINDRYGHSAGDEALRRVAATLQSTATAPGLIGRLGGEEFAILATYGTAESAREHADDIRKAIASLTSGDISLTISVGLAYRVPGETVEKLLQRADDAMLSAKRHGRNRVEDHPVPA